MNRLYNEKFYYEEIGKNEIVLFTGNDKITRLYFYDNSVKVKDSCYIKEAKDQVYIVSFIYSYKGDKNEKIKRDYSVMLGEFRLHNFLYSLGYKTENTQDVDLDFESDYRWYVNLSSHLF